MKKFDELTREEKGELLLSHLEGRVIEFFINEKEGWREVKQPEWSGGAFYRVKPERVHGSCKVIFPNGNIVTLYGTFEVDEKNKPVVSSWIPNS